MKLLLDEFLDFVCILQEDMLQSFFSIFYFAINVGSLISMLVTPILRGKSFSRLSTLCKLKLILAVERSHNSKNICEFSDAPLRAELFFTFQKFKVDVKEFIKQDWSCKFASY